MPQVEGDCHGQGGEGGHDQPVDGGRVQEHQHAAADDHKGANDQTSQTHHKIRQEEATPEKGLCKQVHLYVA